MRIDIGTGIEQAIFGGAFFGGGGGGFVSFARRLGAEIMKTGIPEIIAPRDFSPGSLVATVSFLGAPADPGTRVTPEDQKRCLEIFEQRLGEKVHAFISCENGAVSTLNGWFLSAATGRPVLDAPADGRAHPTGVMGSLGLEKKKGYTTIQAFVGGDRKKSSHIEGVVEGTVNQTASVVRSAAASAGGLILVIRHPIHAGYAIRHGAPGAIRNALAAGEIIRSRRKSGGASAAEALVQQFGGHVLTESTVQSFKMTREGGFDKGCIRLKDGHEIYFLNEYLALDYKSRRIATFPDLICTLDAKTGIPLCSGELKRGDGVILLVVPGNKLKLGAGVKNPANYIPLEQILGKPLLRYAKIPG